MTLGRANNMDMLFFHKPIKKCMSKTASVLDTGTSGSTPVGDHDLGRAVDRQPGYRAGGM
jgi:hypothetical protein